MSTRELELEKYLEKKKKQRVRDELISQIAALTESRSTDGIVNIKNKLKRKARRKQEEDLLDSSSGEEAIAVPVSTEMERVELNAPEPQASADVCEMFEEMQEVCEKQKIQELGEIFTVKRCEHRLEEVEEQRKKLEIYYEEAEIVTVIKYNLITFLLGETGCGKTTQIPQFLYENGFSVGKLIGITQPRRFSAISISNRINAETNEKVSGYKIKYENTMNDKTGIQVMTEGVLLREIESDFLLMKYSVIILDEVHERSATMDVLIGLLSKIVAIRFRKKEVLRIILMSATIEPAHFRGVLGSFEVINLKSRRFPVTVFHEEKTEADYVQAAFRKVEAILSAEQAYKRNKNSRHGDVPKDVLNDPSSSILVFLPSTEDIYTLKTRIESLNRSLTVLPLHSSLSRQEQSRVFLRYDNRKVVLATNIAETSITIDDVVFVVDCGREKRKIVEQSILMYKTMFVSKSSARQRAGRAGRTSPGVCYRMYSGDSYEKFAESREPEILVEPFDSIFLRLKVMGIRNVFGFPFIDSPDAETIRDSVNLLTKLGALDAEGNITRLGKRMSAYPVAPRYCRLLAQYEEKDVVLFARLALIISVLSGGVEIRKNERTSKYYDGAGSDCVAHLRICVDFVRAANRQAFSNTVGISVDRLEEIDKMAMYIMKIAGRVLEECIQSTAEEEEQICKILYHLFVDQLAIRTGNTYLFNGGTVLISKDGVNPEGQNIVFDHLVFGGKNCYARNVTVVPASWFKR